jgi:hypothetical protein
MFVRRFSPRLGDMGRYFGLLLLLHGSKSAP